MFGGSNFGTECATRCVRSLCAECRGVFPSSLVFGVALFAGGPVPCLCSSCFHGLVLGTLFSAPRLSAAGGRLLPALRSCRPAEVSFGLRSF